MVVQGPESLHNIVLCFFEGGNTAVLLNRSWTRIIGSEGEFNRTELVELCKKVARAAIELKLWVFIIGWVDPEIFRCSGYDLCQTKCSLRATRSNAEIAFLLDQ